LVARENVLDAKSETFLPDLTQVLRAVFAFFRLECGERGMRDVGGFLRGEEMCRQVLRKFSSVPAVSREVKSIGNVPGGFGLAEGRSSVQWYCLRYGSRLGIFVVEWFLRRRQKPGHWLISDWL
jgi:hypothetical protein